MIFTTHLTQFPYQIQKPKKLFLPQTETITLQLLQKYQNFDLVIRQLKSWHKYKTKPAKADATLLGNNTLLRYFRKFFNTTMNESTDLLEYQTTNFKVTCSPSV